MPMVENFNLDLAPGGGGGIGNTLRPVANYDDEDPSRKVRAAIALVQLHEQKSGTIRHPDVLDLLTEFSKQTPSDTLARTAGHLALEGFNYPVDQSLN
jgi:hypothetical protein